MPTITVEQVVDLLTRYVQETGASVDLLLIGALALQAYGHPDRATQDIDAEINGPVEPLLRFLVSQHVPADLTQNISGWSVIAMPPGYRDRATDLFSRPNLRIRLLAPIDFIVAKLRRGTEEDFADALLVARQYRVSPNQVQASADAALTASPQDTMLFLFRKTVDLFCLKLTPVSSDHS